MAQLKISDLSVGDWVEFHRTKGIYIAPPLFEKANARVIGTHRGAEVSLLIDGKREFIAMPLSAIHPIPITPEILDKNGWKYETHTIEDINGYDIEYKCYRHTFYRDRYRYDIVLEDSYGGYYQCTIESSIPDEDGELRFISVLCSLDFVEYLHQLQHAMRLSGVEKEIEL